jgi:primosomal protein N' (replication factor Y)
MIVMDEEHEPSYKQEDRPRYHTREVALKRAEQTGAVLLMGSATPSLESYWKAKQGIYTLVELTSRVEQKQLPPVTLIDQRPPPVTIPTHGDEPVVRRRTRGSFESIFSEPLKLALEQRLARREQSMLFVNRRGFTPFMRCATCGWVARCPRCSTTLAWHFKDDVSDEKFPAPNQGVLQCHACLHQEPVPVQCPTCKGLRLRHYGIGTQRVEQELKRLFPFVKSARLDRDVASSRKVYEQIYRNFLSGSIDVLIGTQMIAKGFDFPRVTLVGVVDADVSLHLPDFRASERTFELIAQVAGRTGRGEAKGQVLVQTHHPEHEALQAAQAHDFIQFYEKEITYRQALRYPPFCSLVAILIRGVREPVVQEAAEGLAAKLETLGPDVDLLGPAPAPYMRIRNQFRYQIILKGTPESLAPYRQFLHNHRLAKAFMSVDVDPVDLL